MESIDNWIEDQSCRTSVTDTGWVVLVIKSDRAGRPWVEFWAFGFMAWSSRSSCLRPLSELCVTYTMFTVFTSGGKLLLSPGAR